MTNENLKKSLEAGDIHIFAMLICAAILIFAYYAVENWRKGLKETLNSANVSTVPNTSATVQVMEGDSEPTPECIPVKDPMAQVYLEELKVLGALGYPLNREGILAKASKLNDSERSVAKKKIADILNQPHSRPLEDLLEIAFARWFKINDESKKNEIVP